MIQAEAFKALASSSKGIVKLRQLILELAVRGLLVAQDPNDEPASVLVEKIAAEKQRLIEDGKIKKQPSFSAISDEEKPFKLPNGWEWTRLDMISQINPRNELNDDQEVSFIPMSLISTSHSGKHGQEFKLWGEVKKAFTHFADGDIGIAKITPCFENSKAAVFSGLRNGFGAGTTELHIVRPFKGTLIPHYVLIYFKAPQFLHVGETKMTGTAGQKRVPKDFVANNPFPLPPLNEQRRIIEKVDELMALCDQLEQHQNHSSTVHQRLLQTLLESLTQATDNEAFQKIWSRIAAHFDTLFTTEASINQLKQVILQLAVMGKLVPQDPNDEPASELFKRIQAEKAKLIAEGKIKKAKPLPPITDEEKPFDLPMGWKWVRFGEISTIKAELVRPEDFEDFRQVAPDCIEKGTGRLTEVRTVREAGVRGPNSRFYKGQIVYSKIRPSLSKVVLVDFDGLCSADMYPIDTFIDSKFLLKQILSELFLKQVRIAENRIKMPKLNQESLTAFVLPIPSISEQHRIVAKVDELMNLCDQLKSRISKSQQTQEHLAAAIVEKAVA